MSVNHIPHCPLIAVGLDLMLVLLRALKVKGDCVTADDNVMSFVSQEKRPMLQLDVLLW